MRYETMKQIQKSSEGQMVLIFKHTQDIIKTFHPLPSSPQTAYVVGPSAA